MTKPRIPIAVPDLTDLERSYVTAALESGWVSSLGEYIKRFETDFSRFCEVSSTVAVSNGTVALEVIMAALGIGPGDEVIVPALTFAAVPATVTHLGAVPVLVDVHPDYYNLDPAAVEAAITDKTRAIVAVHSYGHPADMDPILALANPRGIHVLEDAAEAHGARYRGKVVGGIGVAAGFSFYGNKILTTGEGGAVTTNDDALAARVRMLKDHAMDPERRYYHLEAGYNFRMTNLQAAMGCAQLERFDEMSTKRTAILERYRDALGDLAGLSLNPTMPWADPVNWLVCGVMDPSIAPQREAFRARIKELGVDSRPFFASLATMPPYRNLRTVNAEGGPSLPVADRLAASGMNLPTSTTLTDADLDHVMDAIRSSWPAA